MTAFDFLRGLADRFLPTPPVEYEGDVMQELVDAGGCIRTDENDRRLWCAAVKRAVKLGYVETDVVGGAWSLDAEIRLTAEGRRVYGV